jgi:hypothetical protein
MALANKSLANITRCVIEGSDTTNLSRYFLQDQVNDRRIKYILQEIKQVRVAKEQSALILDDTLCEHVLCISIFLSARSPKVKRVRQIP